MSHFTVLVITKTGEESEAEKLLAPFDENIEVKPYETSCWCVGNEARRRVHFQLESEMPIELARQKFYERDDVKKLLAESQTSTELERLWEQDVLSVYEAREKELQNAAEDINKPDSSCNECNGSGVVTSTYNQNAKWDWYVLGGRWDSGLDGKNITPITTIQEYKLDDSPFRTFAIVTPDGEWLESGKIGWFATVQEEKDPNVWESCYVATLEKYRDCIGMLYDCHI